MVMVRNGQIAKPSPPAFGANFLTVGTGGRFSNLDDALIERATIGHILLAGGMTGSIAQTGLDDSRIIQLTGTPLSALLHLKGNVGVRIGGAGNPILMCTIVSSSKIQLFAPIAAAFAGAQVDVYRIVPVGISILPGETISLGTSGSRTIPAFTTFSCPVPLGAAIFHEDTVAGNTFMLDATANAIYFKDLNIGDATHKINSIFLRLPTSTAGNSQTLCEYGFKDCRIITASQDFVYAGQGSVPVGALRLHGNFIHGTYDIINPMTCRALDVLGNTFRMQSIGDFESGGGDSGEPTALVLGQGSGHVYPHIRATIKNNIMDISGVPSTGGDGAKVSAIEIRSEIPSNAIVDIAGNEITCTKVGGTGVVSNAVGVRVSDNVVDPNTPTILVRSNTFDVRHTAGAAGTAYSMHSNNINYSIKRAGNFVKNGTLGSNTAAMAVV